MEALERIRRHVQQTSSVLSKPEESTAARHPHTRNQNMKKQNLFEAGRWSRRLSITSRPS